MMTTKSANRLSLAVWAVVLGIGLVGWFHRVPPSYSLRTFQTPNGWGYDVLRNDTPLIHQPTRPGVAGLRGFNSREHAQRVGERMLMKIRQGQFPPTLRPDETE